LGLHLILLKQQAIDIFSFRAAVARTYWPKSLQHSDFDSTENSIPEKMDHCKIAVRLPMRSEVQFPFSV